MNSWFQYLSPANNYYITENPEFWRLYPEFIIFRHPFWWIPILVLIHCVRLKDWDSFNPLMKGLIIFLLVEGILSNPINEILVHITHVNSRLFFPFNYSYFANLWYLRLSIFLAISFDIGQQISPIIIYIFLIYVYLTIKPDNKTRSILISRIGWICFASIQILFYITFAVDQLQIIPDINPFAYDIMAIFEGVSMIVLMSILFAIPEALLISKYQLFRAKNLYALVDIDPIRERFVPYKTRVREYILSLPPDILKEIEIEQ